MKIKPFKDPLTSARHLFSEVFEDKVPEYDFTIVVRRMGHGSIRREQMRRIRTGEMKPNAMREIAERYGEDVDFENLTDEQMAELATMDEANSWAVPLLVEDLIDLPVPDEDGEIQRVKLSDHPDDFDETVAWLLAEYPELGVRLTGWAQEAEKRYQEYVGSAKKASGRGSTRKRGARRKSKSNGSATGDGSTLSSEQQSAPAP